LRDHCQYVNVRSVGSRVRMRQGTLLAVGSLTAVEIGSGKALCAPHLRAAWRGDTAERYFCEM
ncbi:MAG: hypothetical protein K2K99_07640, partial [Muribaculaceae bacterium]|nr:hypothetical protein [Muribaculaceae bacterium]